MGMTMQCPNECGHSGEFALFDIVEYKTYEKPGQYGDAKQKKYVIQITTTVKEPLPNQAAIATIKKLKAGDKVTLNWNHNYVKTTFPNGTSMQAPERVIVKLEKLGNDEKKEAKPQK
eukprot:Seg20596.1 transcript_id=Seg20596.1/GoldUCD/mRNA.D3Y31 product="hypothetical protein" protein_id=Seg20596.1/GoldUCD/D3Y31